jgi:hypothetical protein
MLFGLRNAGQSFQRFMDQVFNGLNCAFVYLDDILVGSAGPEEHSSSSRGPAAAAQVRPGSESGQILVRPCLHGFFGPPHHR